MFNHPVPKVAVLQDVSGMGRCSLSVSLPVLSVMGIQPLPLPTAVLSTQTDGYTGYTFLALEDQLLPAAEHWKQLGVACDAVLTGFLCSAAQIQTAAKVIELLGTENTLTVVDPVMADGGAAYDTVDRSHMDAMCRLARLADIITPNETEARILCGMAPDAVVTGEQLIRTLPERGYRCGVITGLHRGSEIGCLIFGDGEPAWIGAPCVPARYPGTGDLFAAILTGRLVAGDRMEDAVRRAVDFISLVVTDTAKRCTPVREGVVLEPHLHRLLPGSVI